MSEWHSQHNNSISPRVAAWHPADLDSGAIETTVKPIFHCNAKPLALGRRVGLDPQRNLLPLDIPTFWFPKSLADPTQTLTDQCDPMEYRSRWVPSRWCSRLPCTIHFMFFVLISFAFGQSQREPSFQWNMDLKLCMDAKARYTP